MNEKEIFERIQKGDEKALEFLYKKYYRMMTKLVITNSGTEEEARDIYQDALIVFWQKATSGNLVPSKSDLALTQKIQQAASLFDIRVIDHIIISQDGYYSFADAGYIEG